MLIINVKSISSTQVLVEPYLYLLRHSHMFRNSVPILLIFCLASIAAFGQSSIDIETEKRLSQRDVIIPVYALKKDTPLTDAPKIEALILSVDGKATPITRISKSNSGKSISVVLDISLSREKIIEQTKRGLLKMIRELGPNDKLQIINFDSKVRKSTPLTGNRILLEQHVRNTAFGLQAGSSMRDAIWEALTGPLSKEKNLKAVIVLNAGYDATSQIGLTELTTAVEESSVIIFPIVLNTRFGGSRPNPLPMTENNRNRTQPSYTGFDTRERKLRKYLVFLSEKTAGTAFLRNEPVENILGAIGREMKFYSLLHFNVSDSEKKALHKLKLETRVSKVSIKHRLDFRF